MSGSSVVKQLGIRFSRGCVAGQAVLSTIFIIGGIIVMISLSLAFLATSFVNTAYGYRIAQKAEAIASAGVADALLRLARDKGFENTGGYYVDTGDGSAFVTVNQNVPNSGFVTVNSAATVFLRTRTIVVVASRDASSSLIAVVSRREI